VLVAGALALAAFGNAGLYVTAALSGLVSSAGATTTAVILYRGGAIGAGPATVAILLATGTSIIVKTGLTLASPNREFAGRVALWSTLLLVGAGAVTVLTLL
jgi:uncharacterized membrane protein (DUF4010 family)